MQTGRQVELYYWQGDNPNFSGTDQWTKAVNVAGKSAIISVDFEHKLNSPAKAKVVLINAIPNYKAGDADSYTGTLTSLPSGSDSGTQSPLFTDFMRVMLVDAHSKLVLLYGRLYDIQQEYNNFQGYTTTVEIKDELEILRGLYVDEIGDVPVTSSTERSDVIKDSLINADAWAKPSAVDIGIAINDTGTDAEDRLQTSAGTYPEADTLRYSRSDSNVLQEIANISVEDPQSTQKNNKIAAIYGYDYYLDSNFASVDNNGDDTRTPPDPHFNYFKRGERPGPDKDPETYGLSVELPTASGFAKTGQKLPMLTNFDFERPKYEIFTDATMTGVRGKETRVTKNFEVINVTSITKSGSDTFKWSGLEFDSETDTTAVDGTGAVEQLDLYTADGVTRTEYDICRVQYQSIDAGSEGYLLISDIDASKFPDDGTSFRLVGASSGAYCLFTATTGRYRNKFPGVKRTYKTQWGTEGTNDSLRRKIATVLSRAGVTGNEIVRGSFNIASYPSYHIDNTMSGSDSTTTVTWNNFGYGAKDVRKYGLKPSMTIGITNAAKTHFTHYNYVTAVSSTTATVETAPQNLAGASVPFTSSSKIRFYVPIRAGDFIFVKNNVENISGNFLVTKVTYSESPGVQNTRFEVVGKDVAVAGKMPKITFSNVSSNARGADGDIVGKGKMAFSFPIGVAPNANTKVKFSASNYRTIAWTAGPILLGNGERHQIAAGNTGNMDAYDGSSLANEVASTYYLYWAPDDPDAIRIVTQANWEATESDDTVYLGWARSASDNAGTYKTDTGLAEVNISGAANADGLIIGGSHVITGSKFQTAISGNRRVVIENDTMKIYDDETDSTPNLSLIDTGGAVAAELTLDNAVTSGGSGTGTAAALRTNAGNAEDLTIAAYDDLTLASGDGGTGNIYFSGDTSYRAANGWDGMFRFQSAAALDANETGAYGTFRYKYDSAAGSNDTLAFSSNQQHVTPAAANANSSFWCMWTDATNDRLHFEPIIDYGGASSSNYAYIGYYNPLQGVLAYYHSAGAGSYTYPSQTFYGDADTGFYTYSANFIGIATGGALTGFLGSKYLYMGDAASFGGGYTWANDADTYITNPSADLMRIVVGSSTLAEFREAGGAFFTGINQAYNGSYNFIVAGSVAKTTAGTVWTSTSDDRLKQDIASITNATDVLKTLNPVEYNWKDEWKDAEASIPNHKVHGFLASEYEDTFSDFVDTTDMKLIKRTDDSYRQSNEVEENETIIYDNIKFINTDSLVPHLVAAIKELDARIASLEGG